MWWDKQDVQSQNVGFSFKSRSFHNDEDRTKKIYIRIERVSLTFKILK